MPLDPQTQALLDQAHAAKGPALYEMPVTDARAALKAMALAMGPPPARMARAEDRKIPGPGGDIPIRIYWPQPTAAGAGAGIAVLIHGGGFFLGDIEIHDALARCIAARANIIVVSVDYRLAPEHRFPAAVDDSFAAVRWTAANAASLGGDPARLAVIGDSAGGNLAAVVCHLAKANNGPALAAQVLLYPAVDLDPSAKYESRALFGGGEYFLGNKDMEYIAGIYPTAAHALTDQRLSPIHAKDFTGLPPALIVTAGHDPLRDEGRHYADRLQAAGVAVTYRCFDSTIHGFISFAGVIPAGDEGLSQISRFLSDTLKSR